METNGFSHWKPIGKAGSANHSTTSSTTGDGSEDKNVALLTAAQQSQVLKQLQLGKGALLAAEHAGVSPRVVFHTLQNDPAFQEGYRTVFFVLTQNVIASAYASAMKGNSPAQALWLKQFSTGLWETSAPGLNQKEEESKELTDEQLLQLAKALGISLPDQTGSGSASGSDGPLPGDVSQQTEDRPRSE